MYFNVSVKAHIPELSKHFIMQSKVYISTLYMSTKNEKVEGVEHIPSFLHYIIHWHSEVKETYELKTHCIIWIVPDLCFFNGW